MLAQAGPTNPFYDALRSTMNRYVLLDKNGFMVMSSEYQEPYFDWRITEGADAFAEFAHANCDLDIYIDDCTATLPEHKAKDLPDRSVADYFPAWRDRFIAKLVKLNGARIVVLNSAGWVSTAANGICIEGGHVANLGEMVSLACYTVQARSGRQPVVSLDWSGTWEKPELGIYRGVFI